MLRNRIDPEQALDVFGIRLDLLNDPSANLLPRLVDRVVLLAHLPGQERVAIDHGVEALLHHVLRLHGHRADLGGQFAGFSGGELRHPLGDVAGQVAHPFEIIVDLQHRHHETEVGGDRLIEGEDLQALLFHLHLHAIDLFVVRHHSLGQIGVAVDERRDRLGDRLLHEGADSQDPLLEMFDLAFDVMGHGDTQPKRPVT